MAGAKLQVFLDTYEADMTKQQLEYMLLGSKNIVGKDSYKNDFARIGKEMEKMAKKFVVANNTVLTGHLLKSIHCKPSFKSLSFYTDEKNERGQRYAAYIEYGFKHRNSKKMVGPFPFMRPAMAWGAAATQKAIMDKVETYLIGHPIGEGLATLSYGHQSPTARFGTAANVVMNRNNSGLFGKENVKGSSARYWRGVVGNGKDIFESGSKKRRLDTRVR